MSPARPAEPPKTLLAEILPDQAPAGAGSPRARAEARLRQIQGALQGTIVGG